jgi:hypothetical protein
MEYRGKQYTIGRFGCIECIECFAEVHSWCGPDIKGFFQYKVRQVLGFDWDASHGCSPVRNAVPTVPRPWQR